MAEEEKVQAVKEGSRWRYARPTAEEVKSWFDTQPLDEGREHDAYLSFGVVIPSKAKG